MEKSLNDITPDILSQVEEAAKCFFVPQEIALMLDIEVAEMQQYMEDKQCDVYRSFHKGWLQSEYDQRKCIFKLALSGSSPAQTMVTAIRDKARLKLMD